jgi:hypothetical protein
MKRRALFTLLVAPLTGLAFAGSIFKTGITEDDFQLKVGAGAVIKPLGKARFEALPPGTKVEIHYKRFGIMHVAHNPNAPNAHHFIIGKASDPTWPYVKIATIEMHNGMGTDRIVLARMAKEAAAIGGEALTDCQRDPLLLEDSQTRSERDWRATDFEIVGYKFSCTVVRRKA